jgi:NADH:ubiquinone oxidoreductase subunit 6 (subunit J)
MDPTLERIIFIIVSVITLGTGFVVVTNRNLFHAALAMMASFLGVAAFYVLLDAGFLAAAQLLVYIGAISILIIFAIMMTRRMMQASEPSFNTQWGMGIFTALVALVLLAAVIANFWPTEPSTDIPLASRTVVPDSLLQDTTAALGRAFVSIDAFVIPFELASVLLLAALVGAILVAWPKAEDET